jgi:hypothetical protein
LGFISGFGCLRVGHDSPDGAGSRLSKTLVRSPPAEARVFDWRDGMSDSATVARTDP